MKIRSITLVILAALGVTFAFSAYADGIVKRVRFAKGKHSATLTGSVVRGDRDTYILGARGGQTINIRISSTEKNAVFQVEGPDGEHLAGAGEGDEATLLSGTLPESGDYKIIVGGTRGNAHYRLTVSIQ